MEELIKNLQASCYGKGEIDYAGLGEYLLVKHEELAEIKKTLSK